MSYRVFYATHNQYQSNNNIKRMRNQMSRRPPDPATNDLTTWGGIHVGRVTAWADALGCTADAVADAAADVPPMMDTAEGKNREKHDRPTAPELRCIAWTRADAERVRAVVG